jgi:ubiquitin fusion degradation protein 1
MEHLGLSEGGDVSIESVQLQKGTFVKIQPHETAFIDLPNPRAVLENALRNYLCLTQGDTIVVEFAKKRYAIDIIETRPGPAIMTLQTDLQVDFAPPKDYVEQPVLKKEPSITFGKEESKGGSRKGSETLTGYTLDGKTVQVKPQQADGEREYDPRRHRITNGVKGSQSSTGNYWDTLKGGRKLN